MLGRELAKALRSGQRVYGTCAVSTSPMWPEMIAGTGADFVFIDNEHVPMDRAQLAWTTQAYATRGIAPIVRVPEPDAYRACMAYDAGAHGVIFPYVETVEQVQALRGVAKFRPLKGERLTEALQDASAINDETRQYLSGRNLDRIVIVNIESIPAMNRLDDILAVPDIDALLVGPHDLSINLGVPEQYESKTFLDAISTIIMKARAANVGVGIHYSEDDDLEIRWAKEGANFMVHSSDIALTQRAVRRDIARFREALGEEAQDASTGVDAI